MPTRPAIFKWRQTEPALILCAVRWYLRYSLSLRNVEELLDERGLRADHATRGASASQDRPVRVAGDNGTDLEVGCLEARA
jgi:hypothetical protein